MNERRSYRRLTDCDLAMLGWQDSCSVQLREIANVEELSRRGIGVIIGSALPVGTEVSVSYGDEKLTGVVRHRAVRDGGHFMGIEFTGSSRNSTAHFHPELLVRLA